MNTFNVQFSPYSRDEEDFEDGTGPRYDGENAPLMEPQNPQNQRMRFKHWAALILMVLIKGSVYIVLLLGTKTIPQLGLVTLRTLIGTLTIAVYCVYDYLKNKQAVKEKWSKFFDVRIVGIKIIGFALLKTVIQYACLVYAYQFGVNSGVASVIGSFSPIVTAMIEVLMRGKIMNKMMGGGLIIGIIGIVVIFISPIMDAIKGGENKDAYIGYILVFIGACSYAAATVYGKKLLARHYSPAVNVAFLLFATIINAILYWGISFYDQTTMGYHCKFFLVMNYKDWLIVLFLGIANAGIGSMLYFKLLKELSPVNVAYATYLIPVVGIIEGAAFGHDWSKGAWPLLILTEIGGCIIVIISSIFIQKGKMSDRAE